MARLDKWAEQAIRVVDEGGEGTSRIRLVSSDGSTWQTWERPFGTPQEWTAEAEALLAELADDFAGEVQVVFVAESLSGTVRSQCPRKVSGRQRKGAGVFGAGQQAPLHSMYEAQAKTVERTLQSANVQLEVLTRTVESQAKANAELLDYIRASNEHQALRKIEETDQTQVMLGQLVEQAPLLLQLLTDRTRKPVPQSVKDSVADAAKGAVVDAAKNGVRQVVEHALTPKGN